MTDYARKCRILRQIQSNKAEYFRRLNVGNDIAMVVVSSFLTFMGFSGIEKIHTYLNLFSTIDKIHVEFAFNLFVFFLFLLVILHLVFRFGAKQSEAERAIVLLTGMINEIDDLMAHVERGTIQLRAEDENSLRQRYTMLTETIPANSDHEFIKARKNYQEKEAEQKPIRIELGDLFEEEKQQAVSESLLRCSDDVMRILKTIREIDAKLYLGGGALRNLVWDYLHGYQSPTPIDDVDVIFFDKISESKEYDAELEAQLAKQIPNLKWSVKNQARMHTVNDDEPYQSIEDAVSKWPETATAFVIRLTNEGVIDIVAPFGFSDLFRLIIAPTPHFSDQSDRVRNRLDAKGWVKTWPKLKVVGLSPKDGDKHNKTPNVAPDA